VGVQLRTAPRVRRRVLGDVRPAQDLRSTSAEASSSVHEFRALKNGVEAIKKSAERYQAAFAKWQATGDNLPAPTATALNAELIQIQRTFLTGKGLPERPWFKHQVYAPGAYTGYGAKPIAAVREYMDQEKWQEADAQAPMAGQVPQNVAATIGKAADDLEKAVE